MPGPAGALMPTLALAVTARLGGLDNRALVETLRAGKPLALPRLGGSVLERHG